MYPSNQREPYHEEAEQQEAASPVWPSAVVCAVAAVLCALLVWSFA